MHGAIKIVLGKNVNVLFEICDMTLYKKITWYLCEGGKKLFLNAVKKKKNRCSLLQERHPGDSKNYNECIRHETMRVAVCDMLEGKVACPEALW